jgi:hypothetical protein
MHIQEHLTDLCAWYFHSKLERRCRVMVKQCCVFDCTQQYVFVVGRKVPGDRIVLSMKESIWFNLFHKIIGNVFVWC